MINWKRIEQLFYKELEKRNIPHIPQYFDGNKTVDCFLPQYFITIEINGDSHKDKKVMKRDFFRICYDAKNDIITIPIPAFMIEENIDEVFCYLVKVFKEREEWFLNKANAIVFSQDPERSLFMLDGCRWEDIKK